MKLCPPLCFVCLTATILSTSLSAADLTLSAVATDKRLWPKEVHLTQATAIKLMSASGQEIGSTQGRAGVALKVLRVEPTRLLIQLGAASAAVDVVGTDLLVQAEAISQRINSTAAVASATPAATATPTPAAPAANTPPPPLEPQLDAAAQGGKIIDFKQGWVMKQGHWKTVSDTEISQSDPKDYCTNAYIPYPQSGKMEFRMKHKYRRGKDACNTIYIFCSDGAQVERGTSYMIVDANSTKGAPEVDVTRFTDNKRKDLETFKGVDPVNNEWIDLTIVYDGNTGKMEITRNGKFVGTCTDPDPIKTGKDFSIGTCASPGAYKDIQIRSLN